VLSLLFTLSAQEIQGQKDSLIKQSKKNKGVHKKFFWQNPNDWILGRVKHPGIVSSKENLMKECEKAVKANQKG
jgi:hypothetical protein